MERYENKIKLLREKVVKNQQTIFNLEEQGFQTTLGDYGNYLLKNNNKIDNVELKYQVNKDNEDTYLKSFNNCLKITAD